MSELWHNWYETLVSIEALATSSFCRGLHPSPVWMPVRTGLEGNAPAASPESGTRAAERSS
jgi:hypothetical protein